MTTNLLKTENWPTNDVLENGIPRLNPIVPYLSIEEKDWIDQWREKKSVEIGEDN